MMPYADQFNSCLCVQQFHCTDHFKAENARFSFKAAIFLLWNITFFDFGEIVLHSDHICEAQKDKKNPQQPSNQRYRIHKFINNS